MVKLRNFSTWKSGIFTINLFLILVTAIFPYVHDGRLKWSVLNHLNLATEMNLAVWWAGCLFLLCGIIAYQLSIWDVGSKRAWYILAGIFTFFSFDEVSSIHERVGNLDAGLMMYLLVGLILGFGVLIALKSLWKNHGDKRGVLLILVGLAFIVSAAPNEYLEHRLNWPYFLEGPRLAFEEGLEITGTFICLVGVTRYLLINKTKGIMVKLLPESDHRLKLFLLLTIGFAFNIGIAWVTMAYIDVGPRGNPAVWNFMGVFFLLAMFYMLTAKNERRLVYILAGGYFMALSAASLYFLNPHGTSNLHNLRLFDNPTLILACQLIILTALYYLLKSKMNWRDIANFTFVVIALGLSWIFHDQMFIYGASGFFAFMTTIQFLPKVQYFSSGEGTQITT